MSYIGWFHVKEHVQSFQNMYGKGGKGVLKAELRPADIDPRLKKKKKTGVQCWKELHGFQKICHAIKSGWEKFLNVI